MARSEPDIKDITRREALLAMDNCLMGGCGKFNGYAGCRRCGFHKEEDARRRGIPPTLDADGLRRRHVGQKKEVET